MTTAALPGRNVNWGTAFAEARLRREAAEQSNATLEAAMADTQMAASPTPPLLRVSADAQSPPVRLQRLGTSSIGPAIPELPRPSEAPIAQPVERPALTPALWGQLTRINDKVNRQIVRRADIQTYGVLDRWATPLLNGEQYGDCEDYVLEKRRALVAAGLPASALSIAVATTSWGESHAVLLVATDKGDYVLDSLTPWILPWRKASLTWGARQVAGAPFRWAMVSQAVVTDAPPKAEPATLQVATSADAAASHTVRLVGSGAFSARPYGVEQPTVSVKGPEPIMTLALASGSPLRGLLH
ncbi:transglutaminase-like cysteine peptidase [Phenylobacterium sp.]|uniref:transglutaminase-like cysteine peptidase n=1 Tax=Phenylobacterium sp. TaxID=1871053 RepID=UPI00273141F0|nr:transglutaminase-like cysteine peptidase [Phenylobacterium sp.]MDP1875908.1 transglutaminase-like cysteine peptidase [Phenylobacterium sp.]